jgi:hypothetical protein
LKIARPANTSRIFATLAVFHLEMSALNSFASKNICFMVVAEAVFHKLMF